MRAAVLNKGKILVRDDVDEPVPGMGQALVEVKACGICGSDLHFAKHGASMLALGKEIARSAEELGYTVKGQKICNGAFFRCNPDGTSRRSSSCWPDRRPPRDLSRSRRGRVDGSET